MAHFLMMEFATQKGHLMPVGSLLWGLDSLVVRCMDAVFFEFYMWALAFHLGEETLEARDLLMMHAEC